jgi:hypothetical protein
VVSAVFVSDSNGRKTKVLCCGARLSYAAREEKPALGFGFGMGRPEKEEWAACGEKRRKAGPRHSKVDQRRKIGRRERGSRPWAERRRRKACGLNWEEREERK